MTESNQPAGTVPPGERPLVWILDDSPMELAMARRALVADYRIEAFTEGTALLERMANGESPAVLVLDWQLPGMSGIEVCRFLRAAHDETALPILMLTVYGHKSDLVDGLNAGANDYLTKPYDAPELSARVATLVRTRLLHERARHAERQSLELLTRERAARTDAERANRAKDDFLAMVSHELRTPLNAILGWTRMVRGGGLSEAQVTKALETVERNAVAQTQLIDDLLDVSRILSGKLSIEHEPVDLVGAIHASVEAVRLSARQKNIAIRLDIGDDVDSVEGDPARLQQVLGNLLTNAIKFTGPEGMVSVALARRQGKVVITVSDTGIGIAPEFLPHVFERFRQGDIGVRRTQGGLGLGLAIVKHIVELHGGEITVTSDGKGLGSTFAITLPPLSTHAVRNPPLSAPAEVVPTPPSRRLAGAKILVVDDDADALEMLATMLERHGATILTASSAESALLAIADHRPDVLVSDIGMPEADGYDLVRRLRALPDDQGGKTPALALTAFAGHHDRKAALSAGFDMYVSKPPATADLLASIDDLTRRS